jgi:hypothetical protein
MAINLSKNKRYLRFLLPVVIIGIIILLVSPRIFTDASERLLQPTKAFEKPAPFQYVIKTLPLRTVRNGDYTLQVTTTGAALPSNISLAIGNEHIPMNNIAAHTFQYTFKNVTEPVTFSFQAAGYTSHPYTLQVFQKPLLKAVKAQIDYPEYTGKKDEIKNSLGDMVLPVGTMVRWAFITEHTDKASIKWKSGASLNLPKQQAIFGFEHRFLNDTNYTVMLYNAQSDVTDSLSYQVQVIPDQYPVLQVQEARDTVTGKQIFIQGTAGDDYGISRVMFHYDISTESNKLISSKSIPMKINSGALTGFKHYFDVQLLQLLPGQKLTYYIEAWDNDGVHGSKATRSEVMSYQMYNTNQLDSAINENAKQINSSISSTAAQTQKMQNDLKDIQNKMLESDKMDWQQKQALDEMAQKQQQLQSQVENIKKRFEEQVQQSQQKQYSEDVKEKQEELEKQLDNLLNNELKEQLKKLQELMQKLNKDQAMQTMQEMEQENKLFDMDMKRLEEQMKKLETQMRLEDLSKKMSDLANKELDLKKQTEAGKKDNANLAKEQKAIKDELNKSIDKDMKDLEKLGKEMKQAPPSIEKEKEQAKKAEEKMKEGEKELEQGDDKKASKSEKDAADNLQDMAESLQSKAKGMDMDQVEIDIKATRQILTNLIRLSFEQEALMKSLQQTPISSPQYVAKQEDQNRLRKNAAMIRDSLFSLSLRLPKLSTKINRETSDLEHNLSLTVDAIENRRVGEVVTRQQYVMTHTNNLALVLNELLSNLLEMQSMSMPSSGSCSKPGGKSPKPSPGNQLKDIITKQQQLGNGMQQMQAKKGDGKKGDEGKKPGEEKGKGQQGKSGGESGEGGEGESEQLSRFAEQQAALRRQIQQLNSLLNSKGIGAAKELKEIAEKMDRNETDLLNKRMTNELLLRQKDILTRLMESEKAIREQEQDDKRSSNSAQEISRPIPPELQKYMQDNQKLLELYKTVPPQLKPYYKAMVEDYYKIIGNK